MKKPALRRERLAELDQNDLAGLAGALPNGGSSPCTIIVSYDSCVCFGGFESPQCNVWVSYNSCVCGTGTA